METEIQVATPNRLSHFLLTVYIHNRSNVLFFAFAYCTKYDGRKAAWENPLYEYFPPLCEAKFVIHRIMNPICTTHHTF